MKKFLFILLLISCKPKENLNITECNLKEAGEKANSILIKEGYDVTYFKRELKETSNEFIYIYSSKIKNTRGGNAEIIISKNKCLILDVKLYQ